jgi:glycolate oxidase
VIFDPADADETARAMDAFGAIMGLGLEMGGTITGEHGVGMLKREWLARELGPASVALHHGIKAVFDPQGILNPGKVFQ